MQVIHEFELGARTYFVDFSEKGDFLATSGIGIVKAWSYESTYPSGASNSFQLTPIMAVTDPAMGRVTTVRFRRDGQYLAWFEAGPNNQDGIGALSNGSRIWDLETNRALPHAVKTFSLWNSFDFVGHDHLMAIGGFEGGIELWDYVKGEKLFRLPGWSENSEQIEVSEDGRCLAFYSRSARVGVFDLKTNHLLFTTPPLSDSAWQIRWNQDGTLLGIAQARALKINVIRSQLAELGLDW